MTDVEDVCRMKVTPEMVWGTLHGVLGLMMVVWWQMTLSYASAFRGRT